MLPTTLQASDNLSCKFDVGYFSGDGKKAIPVKQHLILLVDDDDRLRVCMEACLSTMGYGVMPCVDAQAALLAYSPSVDLLLTDLQMPGRSGAELARELTLVNPSLPVVIVSGSLLPEDLLDEIEQRRWKFFAKPCSLDRLFEALEFMLFLAYRDAT